MKIILTRDGVEKSRVNTGEQFDDRAAVKFLADIITENKNELIKQSRE